MTVEEPTPTPPEPQPKRSKKKIIILASITLTIILGVVFAKDIVRYAKSIKAERFYQTSRNSYENNDISDAIAKAVLAVQLDPHNREALKWIVDILTQINRIEALTYWDRFLKRDDITDEEIASYIEFCLNFGHLERAAPYLESFLNTENPKAKHYLLGIQYFRIENRPTRALQIAYIAFQRYPDNPEIKLVLSQLLLTLENPESMESAYTLLKELSTHEDPQIRLQAYVVLVHSFSLTEDEKNAILSDTALEDFTQDNSVYFINSLKIKLDPNQRIELIENTIDHYLSKERVDLTQLGRWLNSQRAHSKTLQVIPEEEAVKDNELLIVYLDAMASLNKWEELSDILYENGNLNMDPFLIELFKTRVALALGDKDLAEAHWNHTFSIARNTPQKMQFLAEYFHTLRAWEYAMSAYEYLLEDRNFAMTAARRMIAIAEFQKNTRKILEVLKELIRTFPQDGTPQTDLTYIELLLDENTSAALRRAEMLYEQNQDKTYTRTTLALAYLKTDQPQKAFDLYKEKPLHLPTALPGWKVVYAATLLQNGYQEEAESVIKEVNQNRLKEEEANLVKSIL